PHTAVLSCHALLPTPLRSRSTLFPYTTLFRSQEITVVGNDDYRVVKIDQELLQPLDRIQIQVVGGLIEKQDIRISEQRAGKKHLDRKSTRLNSSHVSISYAVFCLKKKTTARER